MSPTESKPYYKIGEVCELTGTQPYVLRFWESEFPTLAPEKNRSGQRIYRKRDIELIERIKLLLYEKEYTIAGARKVIESDLWDADGQTPAGVPENPRAAEATEEGSAPDPRAGAGRGPVSRAQDDRAHSPRRAHGEDQPEHALPTRGQSVVDQQLEAEVKNLRAKLAHAEAELRALLADMERRNDH